MSGVYFVVHHLKSLFDLILKVFRHSSRDKRDLRGLEVDLVRVQQELKAVKEKREQKYAEGLALVSKRCVWA